jgi:hypothetical protein
MAVIQQMVESWMTAFEHVIADRGYAADHFVQWIIEHAVEPAIPPHQCAKAFFNRVQSNLSVTAAQTIFVNRVYIAALEHDWSNGQTEGQITRLKFIKRQMYGRASFDLPRQKVL